MLLPAAFVVVFLDIPFLHPRADTFDSTHALAVLLKLAALVTATVLLTSREVFRALSRRGWPLGFGPTASRPMLLPGPFALACAPAASALLHLDTRTLTDDPEWIWIGLFGMLGLILLLFLIGAITMMSTGARRLQTATGAHILSRHLIVAAALLAAGVMIQRSIESRHVARAKAERIDTPAAIEAFIGRAPLGHRIRQIYLDYLDTAPKI